VAVQKSFPRLLSLRFRNQAHRNVHNFAGPSVARNQAVERILSTACQGRSWRRDDDALGFWNAVGAYSALVLMLFFLF
jgi:hypothetical protein